MVVVILLGLLCSSGIIVAGSASTDTATPSRRTFGKGWLEYRTGFRVLFMQGTPYEMGLQHGTLLKNELQQLAKHLNDEPVQKSITGRIWEFFTDLYQRAVVISRALREVPQQYHDEMRGIAAGAGLDLETVLLLQYYYEALGPRGTGIVKFVGAPVHDRVFHGYNLEAPWPGLLADQLTVLLYKPHDGQGFVSIGWPGLVGVVQGMNQSGLSLTYSAIIAGSAPTPPAIPGLILMREALQHGAYVDEVYATFATWPRSGSAIITAAATKDEPDALVIEYNAQRISQHLAADDHLTTTAVFTTPALLPFSRIDNIVPENRRRRVDALLLDLMIHTPADFVALLRDRHDADTGTDSFYNNGISNPDVIASTVFHPKQQVFWVARASDTAPAPFQQYIAFDLNGELVGKHQLSPAAIPASPLLEEAQGEALALYRQAHALTVADGAAVDWRRIAALLEQVVAIDPAAMPLYRLSEAYTHINRYDGAQEILLRLLQQEDTHPYWRKRALLALGGIYEQSHAYTPARAAYEQALHIQIPAGPYLYEQGALDEAINELLSRLSTELRSQQ
jgi:hypothetical protein